MVRRAVTDSPSRRRWIRKRALGLTMILVAILASLLGASPASAGVKAELAEFSDCPINVPGVYLCLVSRTTSGEFHLGSKTVPINKTVTLQGGLSETTQYLVPAADGNTLSKTALQLPGGLIGVELLPPLTEVTATAEIAGPVEVNISHLKEGTAVALPVKVKLDNPALGPACYIGSASEPVSLQLTGGTTNPPPPNTPIQGNPGTIELKEGGKIDVVSGASLVDNAFSAPGVNGCGGLLSLVVDPSVDLVAGLPSAAGHNTAILNSGFEVASAQFVKREAELPQIGRCEKVKGVKEEGELVFHGDYEDAGCVSGADEGRFKWTAGPGPKPKFTGTGGSMTLQSTGGRQIRCTASTATGQYTGLKTATAAIRLTGCKDVASKVVCQSGGAAAGEIVTSTLEGQLGFIKNVFEAGAIQDSVGLDLTHAPTLLTAECGGSALSVTGSVIGAVTAINKMVTSLSLTYSASGGKQIPEQFEEEPKDTLVSTYGGGPAEQTGLTTKLKLANEEKIEVVGLTE
jgi:hypothetical protein